MGHNNIMSSVLLFCVALFCLSATLSVAQTPPVYIFGDSLYDTGMSLYSGTNGGARYWPYGETHFGQPSGRYCDGRVIPDYLAEFAGLPYAKPYLLPGLNDFTKPINFASAGACVLVENRPGTINLKKQVDYFNQMVQKLKQQVGVARANVLLGKAVYLFNIAGNDYVDLLKKNKVPLNPSIRNSYMNQVIGTMTDHIKTIYNQGGRKFAFQNIGPLGCMPSVKYMLRSTGGCSSDGQSVAKMHNDLFAAQAKRLAAQLPGFKYSIYDSYTSAYSRVINGNKFGFSDTGTACCGSGTFNGDFTCQMKDKKFTVCPTPSDHLYFDAGHYTEKANSEFSQEFWSGGSNVVAPYNFKSLFNMN